MQYVKLGHSGLDISPICIGCMGFGDPSKGHPAWSLQEEDSRVLIRHALEARINFFDTANMYSMGTSEEFLGRALKDLVNRDAVVIATKLAAAMRNGPNAIGLSRTRLPRFRSLCPTMKRKALKRPIRPVRTIRACRHLPGCTALWKRRPASVRTRRSSEG
jgi:aryl-alcohol dehydrogenase-like predicted oxidoreductase